MLRRFLEEIVLVVLGTLMWKGWKQFYANNSIFLSVPMAVFLVSFDLAIVIYISMFNNEALPPSKTLKFSHADTSATVSTVSEPLSNDARDIRDVEDLLADALVDYPPFRYIFQGTEARVVCVCNSSGSIIAHVHFLHKHTRVWCLCNCVRACVCVSMSVCIYIYVCVCV